MKFKPKQILEKLKNYPGLILILLLGFTSFSWFADNSFIAGGDNMFYLNPLNYLRNSVWSWDEIINLGNSNLQSSLIFPFLAFWKIFQIFGLSDWQIQRLWLLSLFTLPGITMYFLIKKEIKREGSAAVLASLLYMFNMFVTVDVTQITIRLVQAFLPLTILFCLKAIKQRCCLWRYPALVSLSSLFYAPAATNPAVIALIPVTLTILFIFYLVYKPGRYHQLIISAAWTIFFSLLVNFWWLSTWIINNIQIGETVQSLGRGETPFFMNSAPLFETFRFMGFWAFRIYDQSANGEYIQHVPFAPPYYFSSITFLTYIPIILALLGLIFSSVKKTKKILPWFFLSLAGLFLTKGANPPMGDLYLFLYKYLPGFWIFREPYAKFTLLSLIGISVLFGWSSWLIINKLTKSKRAQIILTFLLIGLILTNAYPLITGQVIQSKNWYGRATDSLQVKIPDYWQNLINWSKKNTTENDLIMLLPAAPYGLCLKWASGICGSVSPALGLLNNNFIFFNSNPIRPADFFLEKLFKSLDDPNLKLEQVLKILRVKFILQQNDLDWQRHNAWPPDKIAEILSKHTINEPVQFDKLNLYQLNNPNAMITSPEKINNTANNLDDLFNNLLFSNIKPTEVLVLNKDLTDKINIIQAELNSQKNNLALYQVSSSNLKPGANFAIVFNQAFDKYWQIKSKQLKQSQIKHFPAFGFLNGWLISNVDSEKIDLKIEHRQQKIFYISGLASLVVITGLIILLAVKKYGQHN